MTFDTSFPFSFSRHNNGKTLTEILFYFSNQIDLTSKVAIYSEKSNLIGNTLSIAIEKNTNTS